MKIIDLKYEAIMDDLKAKENEAKQEAIKMKQLSENITDLRCYFDGLMASLTNMLFSEKKYSEIVAIFIIFSILSEKGNLHL